ncbi:MAG: hypothetical protein JOS17DRAFT_367521 [Linnemannia elongata]|nr:MAG: hypothetical protein JOS17DRAFT_367521 [Linnemannia elongata]
MTTSGELFSKGSMSACSRTMAIPELSEHILDYVCLGDLRNISLVCRDWNRMATPALWITFNPLFTDSPGVQQNSARFWTEAILRLHGTHIRKLYCHIIDGPLLDVIVQSCPSLEFIHLIFDTSSSRLSYGTLDRFFSAISSKKLRAVSVDIVVPFLETSLFWSVARLRGLEELTILVRSKGSSKWCCAPEPYLGVSGYKDFLDLCPGLRSFELQHQFTENPLAGPETLFRRLGKMFEFPNDRTPKDVQEALARLNTTTATATIQGQSKVSTRPQNYNLRHLIYKSEVMTEYTFRDIIERSPFLTNLDIRLQWEDLDPKTWTEISTNCPLLKDISFSYMNITETAPLLSHFISLFQHLESITLYGRYLMDNPEFSTVDKALREFENQHNRRQHPLKRICLSGMALNPLIPMLDLFKRGPRGLESLVMLAKAFSRFQGEPSRSELNVQADMASATWTCMQSLTRLEMATSRFVDAAQTMVFFRRLQEFTRLVALRISRYHLSDLIVDAKVELRLNAEQCMVIDEGDDAEESNQATRGTRGLGLLFPVMRSLVVEPTYGFGGEEIQVYEARLLIDCCPRLKSFECFSEEMRIGSTGSELRREYPWLEVVDRQPVNNNAH